MSVHVLSSNCADHLLARPGSSSKSTVGYFPGKLSDRGVVMTSDLHVSSSHVYHQRPSCSKTTLYLHYYFQLFYFALRCFYGNSCFCLQGKQRWRYHIPPKVGVFVRDITCHPMRQLIQVSGTELT
jgi:hypothetical protein